MVILSSVKGQSVDRVRSTDGNGLSRPAAPLPSIATVADLVTGGTLTVMVSGGRAMMYVMDAAPTSDGPADAPEPDVQLSFANERTFLAWERTALGLITAGLAITQLLPSFDFPGGRRLIGLPLIALGTVIALMAYWEWHRNQEAMRHDRPL